MTENSYPNSCQFCGKVLHGPVSFCPYCAVPNAVHAAEEIAGDSKDIASSGKCSAITVAASVSTERSSGGHELPPVVNPDEGGMPSGSGADTAQPSPVVQEQVKSESPSKNSQINRFDSKVPAKNDKPISTGKTVEVIAPPPPPPYTSSRPGNLKWVVGVVVLVAVIVGYFVLFPLRQVPRGIAGPEEVVTTPGEGRRESARILARETLSQGTALSLAISNLPKLERVLEAAQKLAEISPRYQEQLTSAENTVSSARNNGDKNMMAYIGKVIELGRYTPEEISYALKVVQSGDLTPREKIVAEQLAEHVTSIRSGAKADPKKIHASFTQRFSDFMD